MSEDSIMAEEFGRITEENKQLRQEKQKLAKELSWKKSVFNFQTYGLIFLVIFSSIFISSLIVYPTYKCATINDMEIDKCYLNLHRSENLGIEYYTISQVSDWSMDPTIGRTKDNDVDKAKELAKKLGCKNFQ